MKKRLDVYDNIFIYLFFGFLIFYFWIFVEILHGKVNPNKVDNVIFTFFMLLLLIIFNCYGKFEIGFYIKNKFFFSLWDSKVNIMFKPIKSEFSAMIAYTFLKSTLYIYKKERK